MGAGCLRHGQIVKGLLYLGFEVLYALFFFGFGWPYLRLFPTLGTTAQSRVWDEAAQIYRRVPGDNSMLILLFSVVTLASLALLFARMAAEPQKRVAAGAEGGAARARPPFPRGGAHPYGRALPCDAPLPCPCSRWCSLPRCPSPS